MYKIFSILGLTVLLSLSACSRQQSDWEKTRASNTTDAYEQFLKKYPSGEFTSQARARVKELYEERDWQKARDTDSVDAYQAFLKQYPEGKWADEARIRIENFSLAAAPPPNGTPANPAGSATADAESAGNEPPPTATPTPPGAAGEPSAPRPHRAVTNTSTPVPSDAASAAPGAGGSVGGGGNFGVQLGAFKTGKEAANRRWRNLSGHYPTLLRGLSPLVSPRNIGSGTTYRLRVVDLSRKQAHEICTSLRAHSQACEVLQFRH